MDLSLIEVNYELALSPSIGEFTEALNSLKTNKTPGPDGIPSELLNYSDLYNELDSFIRVV